MCCRVSLGKGGEALLHILLVRLSSPFSIYLLPSPCPVCDGAFPSTEYPTSGIDPYLDGSSLDGNSTNTHTWCCHSEGTRKLGVKTQVECKMGLEEAQQCLFLP